MSQFTTRNLTGERVLVRGTDIEGGFGEAIVNASQWNELKARAELITAGAEFDAAVAAFYAPLLEAAEKANKKIERPDDNLSFVVLDEGQEGQVHRPAQTVRLTKDSMVLRLIEDGNTDRLVWVAGELEILEQLPVSHTPVASGADVVGEENMPAEVPSFDQVAAEAEAMSERNSEG